MVLLDALGRLVVAGAFGWAAVAKLADLPGLRATLYLSRLTRPWVPQVSAALPAAEVALGCLLLAAGPAGWWAAAGSALLLAAFTAFLAFDPHAGEGCSCFGRRSASSRSAGVLRDLLLLAVLVPALVRGPSAGRPGLPWAAAGAAVAVGLGVVAWAVHREGRSRGRRRAGLPPVPRAPEPRRPAPAFAVPTPAGPVVAPRPGALLVFVEPGCGACAALLDRLPAGDGVIVLVGVRSGEEADAARLAAGHGLAPSTVAPDVEGAIADTYGVTATPSAVRVAQDGSVPERPATGVDAIEALLPTPP